MDKSVCTEVYETIVRQYGDKKQKIMQPADILQFKQISNLSKAKVEKVMVILINSAGEAIKIKTVTVGLVNHSLVHPREIYRDAILANANSIIIVHNHPSGNVTPSAADIAVTAQVHKAGSIIGIDMIDHIIVSKTGIFSMREGGYI